MVYFGFYSLFCDVDMENLGEIFFSGFKGFPMF